MMKFGVLAAATLMAGPAMAHNGLHVHPHEGASWLTVVAALAVLAVAGGVAVARVRAAK